MSEIAPPIKEVVSWVSNIWDSNANMNIPKDGITEHIRELFYERKNFWYGVTNRIITEDELVMGLSQHTQTWIKQQLKLDCESSVIGVFTEDNQASLLKVIKTSLSGSTEQGN